MVALRQHARSLAFVAFLLPGLLGEVAWAEDRIPDTPTAPPPATDTATSPAKAPVAVPAPLAVSQDARSTLDPGTFVNTMRAAMAYHQIAEAGGWPRLPEGGVLKPGDVGPAVEILRRRLVAEGDLAAERAGGPAFDQDVTAAVKRFQLRYGLPESGAVRARTLRAMNVPAASRHRQLVASAQRLLGSTFGFGERYVVVNIPAATVEAVEGGRVVRRYVAVVGKPNRPSPSVETRITAVNLHPTWTVPVSLIRKDIIPQVRKDPAYLARMQIRILDGKGQEVDPGTLDWSNESAANYTLRQDPGALNSLGRMRIDMPNRHAVYMHDTPTKRLFAQDERFHSSGCVRVSDVQALAEWLLRDNAAGGSSATTDVAAALASDVRQDIRLAKPVPVAWTYLTGYATADGTVHFRDDVYGLDAPQPEPAATPLPEVTATSSVTKGR